MKISAAVLILVTLIGAAVAYLFFKLQQTSADLAAQKVQQATNSIPLGSGFGYLTVPGGTTGSAAAAGIAALPNLINAFSNLFNQDATS
jgi:hypothetical protein